MKAYTDLEQSKKLAEILPLESADMDYIPVANIDGEYSITVNVWGNDHIIEEGWIPAWSLSALLDVLPKGINISTPNPINALTYCCWNHYDEIYANNPIDACYEMIIKLKENNLL